jgi:hypothetical protein
LAKDHTAQYRFSALIVEQAVFRLAEEMYINNKLSIGTEAPVSVLREFIDRNTQKYAPKILRVFMK